MIHKQFLIRFPPQKKFYMTIYIDITIQNDIYWEMNESKIQPTKVQLFSNKLIHI